jgi:hypothetical protein
MRMQLRRYMRLTNAFSKKLDNLKFALAIHFAYRNFCRIHGTLRVTPAMEAGLTDHVWSIAELLGDSSTNHGLEAQMTTDDLSADGFAALYPQPSPFLRATT